MAGFIEGTKISRIGEGMLQNQKDVDNLIYHFTFIKICCIILYIVIFHFNFSTSKGVVVCHLLKFFHLKKKKFKN